MIKKTIIIFSLIFSLVSVAQESTSSPYSFYGIGDQRFKGTVENRFMGGLGVIPDSIHLNLQNPATYSALNRTTFVIGGGYNSVKMKTSEAKDDAQRTTLDYLAVGIPMGKLGIAFGLIPFSSVGYKIQTISDGMTDSKRYTGEGGMNKVFLGAAYQITKKFSIGADANYNFGNIETSRTVFKPFVQYGTRELNRSDLSGVNFNFGAVYQTKFKEKYDWVGSFSFSPNSKLKSQNKRNIALITYNNNGVEVIHDQIDKDIEDSNLTLPGKLALGMGFGEKMKWFLGTEVALQQSKKMDNLYDDITGVRYQNGTRVSLGGYYVPNYASFTSYWSKVTYRAGLRFEKTGLVIADQSINDYVLSLGAGLPVGRNFSNVNIGFEFGRRGTTKAALVQENYFNLIIGLSLSDKWFVKSKYD